MLNKNTKERIEKDASDKYGPMSRGYMPYMVGASAEAERAQGLVEALGGIKKSCEATGGKFWQRDSVINDILKQVREALTKYNNSK